MLALQPVDNLTYCPKTIQGYLMKKHRILACTAAAILTFSTTVHAFEPVLDPLSDLSSYPTQLLVDGQSVKQGALPQYIDGTALLPLRNILEQAGYPHGLILNQWQIMDSIQIASSPICNS